MINHNKPYIDSEDKKSALAGLKPELISSGHAVKEFEKRFSTFFGLDGALSCAVSSGTSALYMALHSLGVRKRHRIIAPSYVCSAVLNAIFMLGAEPVLADINEGDFNISFDSVKRLLSRRVKAVIVPHIYGVPADIDRFKKLGVPIIEDCAQAIGAKYKSRHVGTFGDAAIFSFYATKIITTGQGGMIYSKDRKLIENALDYREFDCRKKYYPRFNFKMTDVQAGLGISQLKKLNYFIERRNSIAKEYSDSIKGKNGFSLQEIGEGKSPVYYRFVIKTDKSIKKLQEYFFKRGIKTIVPIEPYELLHRYLRQDKRQFSHAEHIAATTLSIPLYPALKDRDVKIISQALREL